MSLADELLADLEEAGDDLQPDEEQDGVGEVPEVTEVTMETDTQQNTVHSIAKLRDSDEVMCLLLPAFVKSINYGELITWKKQLNYPRLFNS